MHFVLHISTTHRYMHPIDSFIACNQIDAIQNCTNNYIYNDKRIMQLKFHLFSVALRLYHTLPQMQCQFTSIYDGYYSFRLHVSFPYVLSCVLFCVLPAVFVCILDVCYTQPYGCGDLVCSSRYFSFVFSFHLIVDFLVFPHSHTRTQTAHARMRTFTIIDYSK